MPHFYRATIFSNCVHVCGQNRWLSTFISAIGCVVHLPLDLGHILVGLEFRNGARGAFPLQSSLLWLGASVLAAALSLDCLVCLIADRVVRHAKGAPALTMGAVTIYPPLVPTSDPGLLHILACLNMAVHSQRAAKSRIADDNRRLHSQTSTPRADRPNATGLASAKNLLPHRLWLDDFVQHVRLAVFTNQMRIAFAFVIIHFIDVVVLAVLCQ